MDEKSYYSLDKVFNRIIERYQISLFSHKLPPQHLQSYSKVWNSFSKWCRAQLEQDRIVLVSETSNYLSIPVKLSAKLIPEDNTRQYILVLT